MATLSLSQSQAFSLYNTNRPFLSLPSQPHRNSLFNVGRSCSSGVDPLRISSNEKGTMKTKKRRGGFSPVCYAAPLTTTNLQWISTVSSAVLMLAGGTGIQKTFIVPLFALQAPASIISWIKGESGMWAAFLALLIRVFFFIPGELELPFIALLLVIAAPYQAMNLRGTQQGAIVSLVIAAYMAYQHFSRSSLPKAFDQSSIVATLAIICITVVSFLLLI